jgi:nucleoside-diphosphate-sugar epimerase
MALDSGDVVFGATGGVGGAVVAELLRRGKTVRAVSRRGAAPEGAEGVAADAAASAEAAAAARGAGVVYHCVSPDYTRWPELLPPVSRSILGAAESSGAKLVFADNLYAYGPVDGPLREDLPPTASGPKGRTRVEVAAEMLAAHQEGMVRVTVGRASDYYGPGGTNSTAGETVFGRVVAGKRPQWTGKLDVPHTLAKRPDADGELWHLPAAEPVTAQQFFNLVFEAAGRPTPAKAQIMGPALLAVAGILSPMLRELRETAYQFRRPFVIDSSKFEGAFGRLEPTPHREAVGRTVEWFRSR